MGRASAAWAERYESLRRYVLEGSRHLPTPPLGLALWLAQGMAGWMRQCQQWLEATAPPPRPEAPRDTSAVGPWQQPLTFLLAQITLQHLQPHRSL